jgi:hypothetical protein
MAPADWSIPAGGGLAVLSFTVTARVAEAFHAVLCACFYTNFNFLPKRINNKKQFLRLSQGLK